MKNLLAIITTILALIFSVCIFDIKSQTLLKYDNDKPNSYSIKKNPASLGWIESVMLLPTGPAKILKIYIYFDGTIKGKDTIRIVGDPSEGAYPPTNWVWSYNTLTPPIEINYDGVPGWDTIDVSNLGIKSDGYDRIIIQHEVTENGPHIALDGGSSSKSFWSDPYTKNQYGFAWGFSRPANNFMVRALIQYDFPNSTNSNSVAPPTATLVDVAKTIGVTDSSGKAIKSARVSIADWNNDGSDDIAIGSNFFQNKGDGTFFNVSKKINIQADASTWGDYDNDGLIDCYAVRGAGDRIYHNNGDGTFSDVTLKTLITNPYPTITPIWFDFNQDGKLDIYISNGRTSDASGNEVYFKDKMWMNNGDGTFIDVSDKVGISDGESTPVDCWAASPCDYNGDGWTDIFVANYRLAGDFLYKNKRDGTMKEVGAQTNVVGVPTDNPNYFGHGLGCDWGDFNNDGLPDLAVGNLGHPDERGRWSNPSLIYQNPGTDKNFEFNEVHKKLGIKFFEMNSAMIWLDLDLDGWLDLYHCQYAYNPVGTSGEPRRLSRMYMNTGEDNNFKFKDATWNLGNLVHGVWTGVRTDYDNDGDLDLIVASPHDGVKIFKNNVERNGKWLKIRLIGRPENNVSKDAYGTSVIVYSGGKKFYRDLQGGGSGVTGSQNSNEIHFGLGNISFIDSTIINYSNGNRKLLNTLKVNTSYRIEYGVEPIVTSGIQNEIKIKGGLIVIPNPILNSVTLHYNNNIFGDEIEIVVNSIDGNEIKKLKNVTALQGSFRLDLNEIQSGNYFIKISGKGKSTFEKIVIEK